MNNQITKSLFINIDGILPVLPYDFAVPTPLSEKLGYCLRVVDSDGCVITGCTSI